MLPFIQWRHSNMKIGTNARIFSRRNKQEQYRTDANRARSQHTMPCQGCIIYVLPDKVNWIYSHELTFHSQHTLMHKSTFLINAVPKLCPTSDKFDGRMFVAHSAYTYKDMVNNEFWMRPWEQNLCSWMKLVSGIASHYASNLMCLLLLLRLIILTEPNPG